MIEISPTCLSLPSRQEKCFRLSMQHMHVFYAHDYTWTLVVDVLTPELQEEEFPKVEDKKIAVWYEPDPKLPEGSLQEVKLKAGRFNNK